MPRPDRNLSDRRRRIVVRGGVGILAAAVAAGLSGGEAMAQQSPSQAFPAIDPRVAPPLAQNPPRLIDPTRVLVTLKQGESRESLRQEAARRQLESSDGTMAAVVAAIEAASAASDRSLVLDLPASGREQDGRTAAPGVVQSQDDFAASLAPEAARLVGTLRQMPQVEAVEPNRMFFANQGSATADSINAILGGGAPPRVDGLRAPAQGDPGAASAPAPVPGPGPAPWRAAPQADAAPAVSDDPFAVLQWHLFDHSLVAAANRVPGGTGFLTYRANHRGTNAAGPVVAIIDTGLVTGHEDVATTRVLAGYDFISLDLVANDGDGRDADPADPGDGSDADLCFSGSPATESTWHGSHVAGIAGVVEADNRLGIGLPGVAVRIVPIRALGRCGGLESDIIDAMRWAAGLPVPGVPANPNPARVINMSLGGPGACARAYQAAVDEVLAAGAIVVVAAGNEAQDARGVSPASCNGVITVAASDMRGFITPYSNFGPRIDILAPGGDVDRDDDGNGLADGIVSIVSTQAGGYGLKPGTSMAAPLVAAAAAALLAERPQMTGEEVRQALMTTALARSSTECPRGCGAGLLQVSAPPGGVATSSVRPAR
ncbi:S8 family serine peptidase [Aurantimonas sp. 22II-16-19i]|uniref:S8 family serine peptidase n=1 Tax=Aurantimonas sp. 22II-16-19i TaxID=1317114 RepID=UPI0009F7D25D|nr:S8 family serine peptidase [Aurantimonas sp. 22II-16-19i]ORE97573.1 peptidase S8/S53 subtilisin kexin sedolisin [Aurantimonas sp. 22II-16-19i]